MSILSQKVTNLPAAPGVYMFLDPHGDVLYVGKAKSLSSRVRSYLGADLPDARIHEMVGRAVDLDAILTDTEVEAVLLEASLIRQHRPHYNILLKDDKSFPYVRVTVQEPFPRMTVTRRVRNDGSRYLGPFTDVKLLRRTLREVRRIFPIRSCRNFEDYRRQNRPCLYYHIKRCVGPCYTRANVDPTEYRAMVDGLVLFLSGRDDDLLRRFRVEMQEFSDARRYEGAAKRRDQIRLLEKLRVPQKIMKLGGRDTDVLGVARHAKRAAVAALVMRGGRVVGKECRVLDHAQGLDDGAVLHAFLTQHYLHRKDLPRRLVMAAPPAEQDVTLEAMSKRAGHRVTMQIPQRGQERRMLAAAERNAAHVLEDLEARAAGRRARFSPEVLELQRALGLSTPPYRMVCFDVSNLGGEGAVAAVVASENGRPRKGLYRRMRMRTSGPDDFAMITEAVERYWTRVESDELPRPDLVVVDGGAGQLSAARTALDRASTSEVPLIGLAKRDEEVWREKGEPLRLARRSASLRALQRLRDEAHRFGLAYHRKLRHRRRIASELDQIPGVGPARRAALIKAFGSVAALSQATAKEIAQRAAVPQALAQRVAEVLAARKENQGPDEGTEGGRKWAS